MNKLLNTLIILILIFAQTSCERVSFDKPGVDSHDGFELNFNVRNIDTRGLADVSKVCNKINFAVYDSIGDRVKIGEIAGDVIEKSLLVTRIRTIKNEIISIPNSIVMAGHTINYNRDVPYNGLIIYSTVTIGYDVPWKEMHRALIDASLRTEFVLHEPKPFVLQTSLDDFYVSYEINAYIKEPNKQAIIYSNLHQNIQDVCNEKGIEIMSPHYRALRDGNQTSIPAEHLPKDYESPVFNVSVKKKT